MRENHVGKRERERDWRGEAGCILSHEVEKKKQRKASTPSSSLGGGEGGAKGTEEFNEAEIRESPNAATLQNLAICSSARSTRHYSHGKKVAINYQE